MHPAALLPISFCWGCTALLGKGFPPTPSHLTPPRGCHLGLFPYVASPATARSGGAWHRPVCSPPGMLCGALLLQFSQRFYYLWSREAGAASRFIIASGQVDSGLFVQGPSCSSQQDEQQGGRVPRGLAAVASVAVGKRSTSRWPGLWAQFLRLPSAPLRACSLLHVRSCFLFVCTATAPASSALLAQPFPVHLPSEQKCLWVSEVGVGGGGWLAFLCVCLSPALLPKTSFYNL